MDRNDLLAWAESVVNWAFFTWPGRIVCGLIAFTIVLSHLGSVLKYIAKVALVFSPIILVGVSAYLFEKPRTFDPASPTCEAARSAIPVASELGAGVIAEPVVARKLRLQSSSTDLSWLKQYWSVQCVLSGTFDNHGATILIVIIDYATSAQAANRVEISSYKSPSNLPGRTHALFGPTAQRDGTTAANVQFAVGRLFTDIVVYVPGQDDDSGLRARDLALRSARTSYAHIPKTVDLDADQPFRSYLSWVWAAWLALLAVLPAVFMTFVDSNRLKLLIHHWMILGLEVMGFTGISARLGMPTEPPVPGQSLVARIRAVRAVRALNSLLSVAVWIAALVLLLRWFPPQIPLWVTSAMLGGIYFVVEIARTAFLGVIPRYRYLRVASWREGLHRLVSRAVEATYIGLVIYAAGRLAIAWIWTPIVTSGSENPAGLIAYMWFFGPVTFLVVSATLRAVSRRVQTRDTEAILRRDTRPQVLYLRSFDDDRHEIPVHRTVYESFGQLFDWSRTVRFEEVLVRRQWRYGPVLAVGRPGERRAELGAARLYYPEDAWQTPVQNWVASSALVVVTMGKTPSLGWELRTLRDLGALTKTIVVVPPTRDSSARASLLTELLDLHGPWSEYDGIRAPLAFRFEDDGSCHVVYGDVFDDVAYELALEAFVPHVLAPRVAS